MIKNLTFLYKKYTSYYSGLSIQCWHSIFLTFIESLATGICFFLSLYFIDYLHISIANAGLLISSYGMGTIFGGIFGGKLTDTFSAKLVSVISLFIQAASFLLLATLENISLLIINLFLIGLCTYGFITSNNVWILKHCGNRSDMKLKSINISRAASNLGMGLSGFIIGILDENGFRSIFYFSAIALIFSGIYFQFFIKKEDIEFSLEKTASTDEVMLSTSQNNNKIFLIILVCLFLVGLIIAQLSVTYPVYIKEIFPEMGMHAVSSLFILDTLLIVIFQAPLVGSLKRFNKIFLVGLGAIFMGLGMFILNFSFIFILAIMSCFIWTTGEMLFVAMTQLVCYEKNKEEKKGFAMGIFQAVSASSRVIGPSIGGVIYYHFGGDILWSISLVIGIICFFICYSFKDYDDPLINPSSEFLSCHSREGGNSFS